MISTGLRRKSHVTIVQEFIDASMQYEPSPTFKGDVLIDRLPLRDGSFLTDINSDDYISNMKFLCNGTHSEIFTGRYTGPTVPSADDEKSLKTQKNSIPIVIKKMKVSSVGVMQAEREFIRETNYFKRIKHSNIVSFYAHGGGPVKDGNPCFIVIERLDGGTLSNFLKANRPFFSRPFSLKGFYTAGKHTKPLRPFDECLIVMLYSL